MTPEPDEQEVEEWLAAATDTDPDQVHRELEEGARRREFVVDELLDSGFTVPAVIDGAMRLTGMDEASARELVDLRLRLRA